MVLYTFGYGSEKTKPCINEDQQHLFSCTVQPKNAKIGEIHCKSLAIVNLHKDRFGVCTKKQSNP